MHARLKGHPSIELISHIIHELHVHSFGKQSLTTRLNSSVFSIFVTSFGRVFRITPNVPLMF